MVKRNFKEDNCQKSKKVTGPNGTQRWRVLDRNFIKEKKTTDK